MSTRSVLAIQTGDTWKGRYCHSDGYPRRQAKALYTLVARDGLDKVRTTLTDTYAGWSWLNPEQPDITGVRVPAQATFDTYPYGSKEYWAWQFKYGTYSDRRWINVPGYGGAYSTEKLNFAGKANYQQVTEDEWISLDDANDSCTEWAYVLGNRDIIVYANGGSDGWLPRGRIGYDVEPTDEIVRAIECGENLEHCGHMAWVHFPEAEEAQVSTQVWLGYRQPSSHDIRSVIVNATGARIALERSGSRGSATDPRDWNRSWNSRSATAYWWVGTKGKGDLRLFRITKAGYKLDPQYSGVVETSKGPTIISGGTVLSH